MHRGRPAGRTCSRRPGTDRLASPGNPAGPVAARPAAGRPAESATGRSEGRSAAPAVAHPAASVSGHPVPAHPVPAHPVPDRPATDGPGPDHPDLECPGPGCPATEFPDPDIHPAGPAWNRCAARDTARPARVAPVARHNRPVPAALVLAGPAARCTHPRPVPEAAAGPGAPPPGRPDPRVAGCTARFRPALAVARGGPAAAARAPRPDRPVLPCGRPRPRTVRPGMRPTLRASWKSASPSVRHGQAACPYPIVPDPGLTVITTAELAACPAGRSAPRWSGRSR
ncbi:hypothetical protein BJY18_000246 [Amycolatopsis jiangsuensis]|uniref:Uncharacterized protein n=1 Tax=Amycolatopsis jiangsuensis TaxID=1181879 RepID=A0A840IKB2_9PSEU|nr:hypothetical protein [Amycolatopsis jiangsuensis]